MRTPSQKLADLILQEPVEQWLLRKRAEGLSWRRISIQMLTEHDIDVTPSTLLGWVEDIGTTHPALIQSADAVAS